MLRVIIRKFMPLIIIALMVVACDKFVSKESEKLLKDYESAIYITQADITVGGKSLPKGSRIKIKVRFNKNWVKVYGYSEKVDELVADQVLIVYLFKESFEKEKFNKESFEKELFEKIKRAGN